MSEQLACFQVRAANDGKSDRGHAGAYRYNRFSVFSPYITRFTVAPSRKWLREIFQEMTGAVPENLATLNAPGLPTPLGREQRRHYYSQNDGENAITDLPSSLRGARFTSPAFRSKFQTDRKLSCLNMSCKDLASADLRARLHSARDSLKSCRRPDQSG